MPTDSIQGLIQFGIFNIINLVQGKEFPCAVQHCLSSNGSLFSSEIVNCPETLIGTAGTITVVDNLRLASIMALDQGLARGQAEKSGAD